MMLMRKVEATSVSFKPEFNRFLVRASLQPTGFNPIGGGGEVEMFLETAREDRVEISLIFKAGSVNLFVGRKTANGGIPRIPRIRENIDDVECNRNNKEKKKITASASVTLAMCSQYELKCHGVCSSPSCITTSSSMEKEQVAAINFPP